MRMHRVLATLALLITALPCAAQRPNILLLMAEDMSARVGAFGDALASTPHLDALAAQGVRYPNTFTTAGVCAPSRAAHILGMYQISTGTQHMRASGAPGGGYRAVPPARAKAYPELLRAAGYYTYTDHKLDYQFSGTLWNSGPFTIWDDEGFGTHWRERPADAPFFGFVNFNVTHESGVFTPLGNWPHSVVHFGSQLIRALTSPDIELDNPTRPEQVVLPPYYPDTPTVRADLARHYDNIAIMDAQVGELLASLEEDGLADSTIVIWTTDHGDGLPRAKRELFDSGIRVPMIIRWPAAFRPEGVPPHGVDTRLVSFVDLAPTILGLAGVAVPDYMQGRDFLHDAPRQYIFAARDRIDEVPDRQRAARDRRFKYIRSWYPQQPGGHALQFRDNIAMAREMRTLYEAGELDSMQRQWFEPPGRERLFDTRNDPFELRDLSGDPGHALVLARLRGALDGWLARVPDWSEQPEAQMAAQFQRGGAPGPTPAPRLSLVDGRVRIEGAEGASLGYRVDESAWKLYTGPVVLLPGQALAAKAVRYGYDESEEVELRLPLE
ncbi:MAG: sulfatase [Halioglobus sp.]|nr:sulfatase [Halioglobus sp.]